MNEALAPLAVEAAEAAAAALPSAIPLEAADAQPGNEHVTMAFSAATITELLGGGTLVVLVGQDLVEAIKSAPVAGLDLASTTQPAVDAAARKLGKKATKAQVIDRDLVAEQLGEGFVSVPLIGDSIDAAVLFSAAALGDEAAAASEPAADAAPVEDLLADAARITAEATAAAEALAAADGTGAPMAPAAPDPTLRAPSAPVMPNPGAAQVTDQQASQVALQQLSQTHAQGLVPVALPPTRGIEMLHGVDMELTVELGRARMSVRDLLALTTGDVLELDRAAGSPADLLVNGRLIARGEVVVVDEDFGLRLTEILESAG